MYPLRIIKHCVTVLVTVVIEWVWWLCILLFLRHFSMTGIGDLVYVRRSLRTVLKWKELGLSLGLKDAQLNMIHEEQQGNMDYCMMQMLAIWLMNIPGASWLTLKAALNNIEEHEVANTLSAGGELEWLSG